VGLLQKSEKGEDFYLIVGLVISQSENISNLVPFDLKVFDYQAKDYKRFDLVTVTIPNDVLPKTNPQELIH